MGIYFLMTLFVAYTASGLQSSVLGAVWPEAYPDLGVGLSMLSYVNMIVAGGRIVAGLASDRIVRRIGTKNAAALGFLLNCLCIFGCANSRSYLMLCVSCILLGFGDTLLVCTLNAFGALHLSSRIMSWLNMVWSIGSACGTYIISATLARGRGWNAGYFVLFAIEVVTFLVFLSSRPCWKKIPKLESEKAAGAKTQRISALKLKGMPLLFAAFFCSLSVDAIGSVWTSSYIAVNKGMTEETAAFGATCLFIGMTIGRFIGGFISDRLGDRKMIHLGGVFMIVGGLLQFLAADRNMLLLSVVVIGMGCSPMFPCFVHYVPEAFGAENTGVAVGFLMGMGQFASLVVPIVGGWIADFGGMWTFPLLQVGFGIGMTVLMLLQKKTMVHKAEG